MSKTDSCEEARWPSLDPDNVKDYLAKELALGVVGQAVQDWKDLCKKIPKKQLCKAEVEKRKCMFAQLRQFFNGDWCGQLCGNSIRRSLIIAEMERLYCESSFLKQAESLEKGVTSC